MILNIIIAIFVTILVFKIIEEIKQYSEDKLTMDRRSINHTVLINNLKKHVQSNQGTAIRYQYRNVTQYKDQHYVYEIMPDFKQICIARQNTNRYYNFELIKITRDEIEELTHKK